jgi:Ca2+/Na+ antiporter
MSVFDINDCYTKDEVQIYRRKDNVMFILLGIVFFIICIALFATDKKVSSDQMVLLFILVLIAPVLYYTRKVHYYKSDEVILTISTTGVTHNKTGLVSWENIDDEMIETRIMESSEGNYEIDYFVYYCKNTNIKVEIYTRSLCVSDYTVLKAFEIYRKRKVLV